MFVDDGFSVLDTCGIMAQGSNKAQEVQVPNGKIVHCT